MASIVTVFQQVWGTVDPDRQRRAAAGDRALRRLRVGGLRLGSPDGRLVRVPRPPPGRGGAAQPRHRHPARVQHSGAGRAMKLHQRDWAAERDIPWITWTFDPLVRRNAWFNIEVLGAQVSEYLVNFYGPMTDSINAHDESDRLVVAWPTDPDAATDPAPPSGSDDRRGRHAGRHRRAAPHRPQPRRSSGATACARSSASGSTPVPSSPGSHARATTSLHPDRDRTGMKTRTTRTAADRARPRHPVPHQLRRRDQPRHPAAARHHRRRARAGASASPRTSRPTRPSSSTVRRW